VTRAIFASTELAPLAQSGGLGDAVPGLAHALVDAGHAITCAIPAHRLALSSPSLPPLAPAGDVVLHVGEHRYEARWLQGDLEGVRVMLLDLPELFDQPTLYGHPDNALRFCAFGQAVAWLCEQETPDVLVAHDHHAAPAVSFLRVCIDRGLARGVGAVQVVHNNAYQGVYPAEAFRYTTLPAPLFHVDAVEFYGKLNLLKCGLSFADRIVTVSPTYAREIQEEPAGEHLAGLYRARAHRLTGIVNGIDTERVAPPFTGVEGKRACRAELCEELGLGEVEDGRLLIAVGRFAEQKGWDLIAAAAPALVERGFALALLGDGDEDIAEALAHTAERARGKLALRVGFDPALAARMYAGGDASLIPSRFEPCGLTQLISQRNGTVPIARRTGGLADTIVDGETGYLFDELNALALIDACERAAKTGDKGDMRALLLALDVGWSASVPAWERVLDEAKADAAARV
jgi:starch synthase